LPVLAFHRSYGFKLCRFRFATGLVDFCTIWAYAKMDEITLFRMGKQGYPLCCFLHAVSVIFLHFFIRPVPFLLLPV
jgi:hypothetical protein